MTAVWRALGTPLVEPLGDGSLHGITLAVKDLFAVAGHRTGVGVPAWLDEAAPAPRHSPVLETLLRRGASVTGIAQTDEFAYSLSGTNVHYGSPRNPWDATVVTGGSSSGPAAAVAQRQVRVGLGTDTAGSIRAPASYCGLFGLRTTHGLVPMEGVEPLAPSFDTVGWLTSDADDLRQVTAALCPAAEPVTQIVLAEDLLTVAEPALRPVLERAAERLASATRRPLRRVTLGQAGEVEAWASAFRTVQSVEAWTLRGAWIERHPGALGGGIEARFRAGQHVAPDELAAAKATVLHACAALRERIPPGLVVALPATSGTAPAVTVDADAKAALRAATLRLTCPAGLGGLPSAVAPAGVVDGLPIGLAVLGAPGSDLALTDLLVDAGWTRCSSTASPVER